MASQGKSLRKRTLASAVTRRQANRPGQSMAAEHGGRGTPAAFPQGRNRYKELAFIKEAGYAT
jgi:hypothetical protein